MTRRAGANYQRAQAHKDFHFNQRSETMDETNDTQEVGATTEQHPPVEPGPTEEMSETRITAPLVPGAQSAESSEVKNEVNPNTE